MRKYVCIMMILITFLYMSQLHVLADNFHEEIATANTVEELKQQIQQAVMQLNTDFDIRYTGAVTLSKEELTGMIKEAEIDPYIFANIASFKWHYSGYEKNIVINFQFNYHHSKVQEVFVDYTLNTIIAPMRRLSNFEKVKAAHDYIVLSTAYSSETINSQYSPYALLTENKAVCQAYALVLYRMLEKLGLEVYYVGGNAKEQLHAWVLVNLDGAWYHIDATWDDPVPDKPNEVRYDYFLLSDEQLARDHEWDRTQYPKANREYTLSDNDVSQLFRFSSIMPLQKYANFSNVELPKVLINIINGNHSKGDNRQKENVDYGNKVVLIASLFMYLHYEKQVKYNASNLQRYHSLHGPQQKTTHKRLVVILKGVSNFHLRDTLFKILMTLRI